MPVEADTIKFNQRISFCSFANCPFGFMPAHPAASIVKLECMLLLLLLIAMLMRLRLQKRGWIVSSQHQMWHIADGGHLDQKMKKPSNCYTITKPRRDTGRKGARRGEAATALRRPLRRNFPSMSAIAKCVCVCVNANVWWNERISLLFEFRIWNSDASGPHSTHTCRPSSCVASIEKLLVQVPSSLTDNTTIRLTSAPNSGNIYVTPDGLCHVTFFRYSYSFQHSSSVT